MPVVSSIATRAASVGYILQASQSDHLCKLSARTHERNSLLTSILIRSRQNGVSAVAQRKETGPFRFEGCAPESGIPSQGKCRDHFLHGLPLLWSVLACCIDCPPVCVSCPQLIELFSRLGANGLLVEYEDMFPYEGELKLLQATTHPAYRWSSV